MPSMDVFIHRNGNVELRPRTEVYGRILRELSMPVLPWTQEAPEEEPVRYAMREWRRSEGETPHGVQIWVELA